MLSRNAVLSLSLYFQLHTGLAVWSWWLAIAFFRTAALLLAISTETFDLVDPSTAPSPIPSFVHLRWPLNSSARYWHLSVASFCRWSLAFASSWSIPQPDWISDLHLLLPHLHLSSDHDSYKLYFLLQSAEGTAQGLRCKQYRMCQLFNELEGGRVRRNKIKSDVFAFFVEFSIIVL